MKTAPSDGEPFAEFVPAVAAKLGRDDVVAADVLGWGTDFYGLRRFQPPRTFVLYLEPQSYVLIDARLKPAAPKKPRRLHAKVLQTESEKEVLARYRRLGFDV